MFIKLSKTHLILLISISACIGALIVKINPYKYVSYFWKSKKETTVVSVAGKTIATLEDVSNLFTVMNKFDQNMSFLMFFPKDEQFAFYKKLIMDYIVNGYLIEKYIKDNNIDEKEGFKSHFNQYMNIMKGSFYGSFLREYLLKNIEINESDAIDFYNTNKEVIPEFLAAPFMKNSPGIDARAIKLDENNRGQIDNLKKKLRENGEGVMPLERVNKSSRCSSALSCALSTMKDGDADEVLLENGSSFLVHRLKEHSGEWADFTSVANEVKQIMQMKMMEEQLNSILSSESRDSNVFIDENVLKNYIELLLAAQAPINVMNVTDENINSAPADDINNDEK